MTDIETIQRVQELEEGHDSNHNAIIGIANVLCFYGACWLIWEGTCGLVAFCKWVAR